MIKSFSLIFKTNYIYIITNPFFRIAKAIKKVLKAKSFDDKPYQNNCFNAFIMK